MTSTKMTNVAERAWLPPQVAEYIEQIESHDNALSLNELDARLHALVSAHTQHMDRECVVLYAGTNIINPRVEALLASGLSSRPNLGYPGDKYNKGMQHAEQIEIMLGALLKRLFNARYVEYRVPSGSIANLYAFMATTKPGDTILAFSDDMAGHVTHHAQGAAGLYGLRIVDVPCDTRRMDVDVDALRTQAHAIKPKLIVVAGSMCLFPYSVSAVREIADEVGAYVLYDAAHMGGLIAGGAFQQPLAEGAHLMTGSTYKSYGGPASGIVLTNDPELAERIERIAYPGLTANFDLGKTAAMCMATMDLLEHGGAYARMMIANAQALAEAMAARGLPVFAADGRPHRHTVSQHVAVEAATLHGGNRASSLLEKANLLMSGIGLPMPPVDGDYNGIRIGTQEVTRWGMRPTDMHAIAEFMARVLVQGVPVAHVREDVITFRRKFQKRCFIREYNGQVPSLDLADLNM
jgi:glycine hydroxymethyltransferase